MFEVMPVPEAGIVPLPLVQVVGGRERVEPEQNTSINMERLHMETQVGLKMTARTLFLNLFFHFLPAAALCDNFSLVDTDSAPSPRPPELAHVVPAVCAEHAHVLETEPHLHILRSLVTAHLALAGVGESLGGQPSQGLCRGKEIVTTLLKTLISPLERTYPAPPLM